MDTSSGRSQNAVSLSNLEAVFDLSIVGNALIVGQEKLVLEISVKYPNLKIQTQPNGESFDLVICENDNQPLKDLVQAAGRTLVLLGHQPAETVKSLESKGLVFWPEVTDAGNGNFMVFRTWKFLKPHSSYFIQQLNSDDSGHHAYHVKSGLYHTSLQDSFLKLTKTILFLSTQNNATSILRASDGDYYFLRKIEIGSAKPGRRALTRSYDSVNISLFRKLFWQNDIIAVSIEPPYHNSWKKYLFYDGFDNFFWKLNFKFRGQNVFKYLNFVFDKILSFIIVRKLFLKAWLKFFATSGEKQNSFKVVEILNKTQTPMEAVYALVASKWLFKNFNGQIGIIAGKYKCELIKLLMQKKEYQEYLGMDSFTDYISVPQKGAADNIEELAKIVGEQIKNSKAKIFLVGIGSAKIGLLPLLKNYSSAIFIDVGAGIDALAGVVCQQRPYFCEWTDFRLKDYDYSKVDFMDQGNPAWNNPQYKTVYIN